MSEPSDESFAVAGEYGALDPATSESTFAEAAQRAHGASAVMVAIPRAVNLYFGLARPDAALAVLDEAAPAAVGQPALADALALARGTVLAFSGAVGRAIEVLEPIATGDPQLEVLRSWGWATALVQSGRLEEARAVARGAEAAHAHVVGAPGLPHITGHLVTRAGIEAAAGDLDEVERLARSALDHAMHDGASSQLPWAHWLLARALLLRGQGGAAFESARAAAAGARTSGSVLAQRVAAAGTAQALALVGRISDAEEMLEGLVDVSFYTDEFVRGRAWVRACSGDLAGARELLRAAVDRAAGEGRVVSALEHAYDLVRLGDAAAAVRVVDLAASVEGPYAAARALVARGVTDGDAETMLAGASAFEAIGMDLHAAEACVRAVLLLRATDEPAASAAEARAAALVAPLGGVRTPGLDAAGAVGGGERLTSREREIAQLAVAGRSNKEIADHLGVSERTVANQLQNVHAKLGVSDGDGDELASAMAKLARRSR